MQALQGGDGADALRARYSFRERQPRREICLSRAPLPQLHIQQ